MLSSWDENTTFLSSLSSSSRSARKKLNVLKILRVNESRFVVRRYTGSRWGWEGAGGWQKGEEPRENVRKGSREWVKEKWVGEERKEGRWERRKKEEVEGNTKANKKDGKRRKEVNQGVRKRQNEVGITSEKGREEDRGLQGGEEVKTMKWVNKKASTDPLRHCTTTSMIQELTQILFQESFGELWDGQHWFSISWYKSSIMTHMHCVSNRHCRSDVMNYFVIAVISILFRLPFKFSGQLTQMLFSK